MTAKEKAKEIYDFFDNYGLPIEQKKQCAIYCADGMRKELEGISIVESGTTMINYGQLFYEEVIKELNKYNPYE